MSWAWLQGGCRMGTCAPSREGKCSKQGLKQGILVHSEQIVKGGGGHWISPLCTTALKFKHESVI